MKKLFTLIFSLIAAQFAFFAHATPSNSSIVRTRNALTTRSIDLVAFFGNGSISELQSQLNSKNASPGKLQMIFHDTHDNYSWAGTVDPLETESWTWKCGYSPLYDGSGSDLQSVLNKENAMAGSLVIVRGWQTNQYGYCFAKMPRDIKKGQWNCNGEWDKDKIGSGFYDFFDREGKKVIPGSLALTETSGSTGWKALGLCLQWANIR